MGCSRVAATGIAAAGLALAGASSASGAPAPAHPYVTLPNVLVADVNQHPQLVGQYGNRGGTTLNHVTFSCRVAATDGSVDPLQRLVSSPFPGPFIPAQTPTSSMRARRSRSGTARGSSARSPAPKPAPA